MSKFWTFVTVSFGLALLFELAGLQTGADTLLNFFGITSTSFAVTTSVYAVAILGILGASAVVSFIAGLFGRGPSEYTYKSSFAVANLLIMLSSFIGIITYSTNQAEWVAYPIYIVFSMFTIGYIQAAVEWVYGG